MSDMVYYGGAHGGSMADHAARKYHGDVATGYDAKRDQSPKWHAEQQLLENIIGQIPSDARVLDVPVGTGRLIPALQARGLYYIGCDISEDMLSEAAKKWNGTQSNGSLLRQASVTKLPVPDGYFDIAFMIRLTRWLSAEDRRKALHELGRVTKSNIFLTARIANHPHAYTVADISKDCAEGWKLGQAWQIGEDKDYLLVELTRQ